MIEGRVDKVKEEYRVVDVHNHIYKTEWVEAQAAVETFDANGKPLTLVGSSLVITNRKKIEMELTTAKDRAEESNRLKSGFPRQYEPRNTNTSQRYCRIFKYSRIDG